MNQLDINEIKKFLPHRYPFLLIDKVLDAKPGEFLKALKNVTVNEPFFQGHFPERPVMPGVLMVEAMAQAAGLLIMCTLGVTQRTNEMYFLAGIDQVRFKRLVEPGDQLILDIKLLRAKRDIWKFEGNAYVNDELACSAEIINARGHAHDS